MTEAKRAKVDTAVANAAITKLTDAVVTMVDSWNKGSTSTVDEEFLICLKKLEKEAEQARLDCQSQSKQLEQILALMQNFQRKK